MYEICSGEKKKEMLSLLLRHRTVLLNILHKRHDNIDCLDYLIYKIKKNNKLIEYSKRD